MAITIDEFAAFAGYSKQVLPANAGGTTIRLGDAASVHRAVIADGNVVIKSGDTGNFEMGNFADSVVDLLGVNVLQTTAGATIFYKRL